MNVETLKNQLENKPSMQILLYRRGYLITSRDDIELSDFPFFGNWSRYQITNSFVLYIHKEQHFFLRELCETKVLLIGHAYNPFNGKYDENEILDDLLQKFKEGKNFFFEAVSELTGIHLICVFAPEENVFVQDCTAMMACNYGKCNENVYLTSNIQIIRDIDTPKDNKYIKRFLNSFSYKKLSSKYLPGDLTVLDGFSRLGPNMYLEMSEDRLSIHRFFPISPHPECREDDEETLNNIANIIRESVYLTTKKWKRPAISLSGGMDSRTTCASANGNYDRFRFFSYYSKPEEKADADAAHSICGQLDVEHKIYPIPMDSSSFDDFELYKEIIERSTAYVMPQPEHEIRKYIYLSRFDEFDVDLKTWASEIGRAYWERRLDVFLPHRLTPRYFNIFQTRYLFNLGFMYKNDAIYKDFLIRSENLTPLFNYEHADSFQWEYRFGSWGTNVATGQEIYQFETTMPMNNRKLMDMFLWFPHEARRNDKIHKYVILHNEPRFEKIESNVHNAYFGGNRLRFEKLYYYYRTMFLKK